MKQTPDEKRMVERVALRTGYPEQRIWQVFQLLSILIEEDLRNGPLPGKISLPCVGTINVRKIDPRTKGDLLSPPSRKVSLRLVKELRAVLKSPILDE